MQQEPWVTIRESRTFVLSCQKCGWAAASNRIEAAMRRAEQHECRK